MSDDIDLRELLERLREDDSGPDVSEFFGGEELSDTFVTFSEEEIEQLCDCEDKTAEAQIRIDSSGRMVLPKTPREEVLSIEGGEIVEVTVRVLQRPDDGGGD